MSTIFAVIADREEIEVALRHGIGNGKVAITWLNPLAPLLNPDIKVEPTDNTAQGVETIGDLIKLQKDGKL